MPTLETVLERINALGDEMRAGFAALNKRMVIIEDRIEQMDTRLDRIESMTNQTRAEMLTLRADFREFRAQFKAPA